MNGIDISTFGAKQLSVDIQTANINIIDAWARKSLLPIFLGSYTDFLDIKVELFFKGNSRDEILQNVSNLISKFIAPVDLDFDGYSKHYKAKLVSKTTNKTVVRQVYTLSLELAGYCYGDQVIETLDHVSTKTINVTGNQPTPAIVTITVPADTISITLSGFGEDPIIIKNLKANTPIIIDGEAGTVTQAGVNKFTDTDMWDFPVLQPGSNTITASTANCTIQIQYKPKYI